MNISQEQFNQILIENMGTAMLLLDDQLRLQYLNPAAEMLFEKSLARFHSQPIEQICLTQEAMLSFFREARENPHPMIKHRILIRLPSGHHFSASFTSTPIEHDNKKFILVEVNRINSNLNPEHEETQQQQYQATRALIRGLAHEIKNPLGGLRGAAQLLESELENEELKEYTGIIMAEADRLKLLIDRLLNPGTQPNKQPCNIHEIIEHVHKLIRTDLNPGISIEQDYDPSIPKLDLDHDQMIQVILNIANNAVESMVDQGTLCFRTRILRQQLINGKRHRLTASICIIDDGPGVPEDLKPQIFYPMISGKASGNGLGLSIAQSLVNRHDGIISVQTINDQTQFEILLPIMETT